LTKYKLCFDTQQELMQWLAAITDVVVSGSVDAYNAEILEANDPSSQGIAGMAESTASIGGFPWQDQSPKNTPATLSTPEDGGHRLWSTEQYAVKSEEYSKTFEGDVDDDDDDDDDRVPGNSSEDFVLDTTSGEDVWGIPAKYMEPAFYMMNAVILASRSETALPNEIFWYVLVFFNVIGVMVASKVKIGGTIQLKPELSNTEGRKRRLAKKKVNLKESKKKKSDIDTQQIIPHDGTMQVKAASSSLDTDNFIPLAGSTSMRIKSIRDLPTKEGVVFPGWREVEPSTVQVRGYGYKSNKKKIDSPNSLYQCIDVDVFESKKRFPDMAGRVVLPTVTFENDVGPKTWNAPDLFVVAVALPTDPPKLYGGSTDNGGGYTLTMYCVMRQETRDILRRVTADGYNPVDEEKGDDPNQSMVNAARLFDEWCRRAPSDDNWMARFKVVPQGNNLSEIGLPTWISNYNGKPFLIKRPGTTGFLYRHPDKSCMEFDVSLHPFPYLAKQGICYMKDGFFKKIIATLAFCIEGRSDDELPECLIGLFQICYPDPIHATQAEEFFAGKSSRSK